MTSSFQRLEIRRFKNSFIYVEVFQLRHWNPSEQSVSDINCCLVTPPFVNLTLQQCAAQLMFGFGRAHFLAIDTVQLNQPWKHRTSEPSDKRRSVSCTMMILDPV